jgi:hypothetical protein
MWYHPECLGVDEAQVKELGKELVLAENIIIFL